MLARNAVLTTTDLSPGSSAALVLAARVADRCRLELDVLHPLGLRRQSLRTALPELDRLDVRLKALDRALRAQLADAMPLRGAWPAPILSFDGLADSLVRRAAQARPRVVVLPAGLDWDGPGRDPRALGVGTLERLGAPVIVAARSERSAAGRGVVLLDAASLEEAAHRPAGCWTGWLQECSGAPPRPGMPLDCVLVEQPADVYRAVAGLGAEPAAALLLPLTLLRGCDDPALNGAVAQLLRVPPCPLVIMPPDAHPPPVPGMTPCSCLLPAA